MTAPEPDPSDDMLAGVRTEAWRILETHSNEGGYCVECGLVFPCSFARTAENSLQVCDALATEPGAFEAPTDEKGGVSE